MNNTWPATFFVGREGRVRSVHAGFASKATGETHARLEADITATVERLLAEKDPGKQGAGKQSAVGAGR